MKLRMAKDRILFKKVEVAGKTKGGIILGTQTAEAEKRDTGYGEIVSIGDEVTKYSVGEIIGFNDRMPMNVMFKGESAYHIREADVWFAVEDEDIEVTAFSTAGEEFVNPQTKMLR